MEATGAARPRLMRTLNEQLLLERMRGNGPVSRSELAGTSGLSKPTVALAVYTRGGGVFDPADRPGLLSFTGRLLQEGTKTRSSVQIASNPSLQPIAGRFSASLTFRKTSSLQSTLALASRC